jgi:hypothetical protein
VDQGATGKPAPSQKVYVTGFARDGSLLGQLQCARMCWRAVFGSAGRAGLLKTQRAAAAGHKPKRQVNTLSLFFNNKPKQLQRRRLGATSLGLDTFGCQRSLELGLAQVEHDLLRGDSEVVLEVDIVEASALFERVLHEAPAVDETVQHEEGEARQRERERRVGHVRVLDLLS